MNKASTFLYWHDVLIIVLALQFNVLFPEKSFIQHCQNLQELIPDL